MTAPADTSTTSYAIDPAHSRVSFAVRHMMLSKVRGEFSDFSGTVDVGSDGMPAHVSATINVASIDTHAPDRDTHLKSADFFEADKYPQMTFESTQVSGTPQQFTLTGNLTIRGVTKSIELKGEAEGKAVDPWGKNRVAFSASGRVNRKDFGLAWNQALETGGVLVGEEVEIALDVQAVA